MQARGACQALAAVARPSHRQDPLLLRYTQLLPPCVRRHQSTAAAAATFTFSQARPIDSLQAQPLVTTTSSCTAVQWSSLQRQRRRFTASSRLRSQDERQESTSVVKEAPRDANGVAATSPIGRYDKLVEDGLLRDDSFQRDVVQRLETLHQELKTYTQKLQPEPEVTTTRKGWLASLFSSRTKPAETDHRHLKIPETVPKGLYLHGDVGTGKSMLMDLFYDTLPPNITHKRRVHFHQFMIDAHKRMHAFKSLTHRPSGMVMSAASAAVAAAAKVSATSKRPGSDNSSTEEVDPIPHVAREFAEEATVLCFDEFQVTDIADAMILRRLFEHMLWHGVVCVATSNRHPDELYRNGIQRSSFVPCIELLKDQLGIVNLDSGTDYRKLPRALTKVYFSPLTPEVTAEMDKLWEAMTSGSSEEPAANREITVWGRSLRVPLSTQRCARFHFMDLCGRARSAADYIEICRSFSTIFIDEIPRMNLHSRDLARRFITFIDSAYESKTRIFASSEVDILKVFSGDTAETGQTKDSMRALMDDLGLTMEQVGGLPMATGEEEVFAFARVLSRLSEMGSKQYAELSAPAATPPEF